MTKFHCFSYCIFFRLASVLQETKRAVKARCSYPCPSQLDRGRDKERYHYINRFFKTPLQECFSWGAQGGKLSHRMSTSRIRHIY